MKVKTIRINPLVYTLRVLRMSNFQNVVHKEKSHDVCIYTFLAAKVLSLKVLRRTYSISRSLYKTETVLSYNRNSSFNL